MPQPCLSKVPPGTATAPFSIARAPSCASPPWDGDGAFLHRTHFRSPLLFRVGREITRRHSQKIFQGRFFGWFRRSKKAASL